MYEHDPVGFQFTHVPFPVVTQPNPHTLCGEDLTYVAKFMNAPIDASYDPVADPLNKPVAYDRATRTHTVYSEEFGLLGPRTYTLSAFMTDYPNITSLPDSEATILFVDPCLDPELVTATP